MAPNMELGPWATGDSPQRPDCASLYATRKSGLASAGSELGGATAVAHFGRAHSIDVRRDGGRARARFIGHRIEVLTGDEVRKMTQWCTVGELHDRRSSAP